MQPNIPDPQPLPSTPYFLSHSPPPLIHKKMLPTKSSAVTGTPSLLVPTTMFPSLSLISFNPVVRAKIAIISLATAISNWHWNTEYGNTGNYHVYLACTCMWKD